MIGTAQDDLLDEQAEAIRRLRAALSFYADGRRYEGPNCSPLEGDPFAPETLVYRYDVTRDGGAVARKALAAT